MFCDCCLLVPAGEGAEERGPDVVGTNPAEVALGSWVAGPGQRGPIQDVESRGLDRLSSLDDKLTLRVVS